MVRNLPLYLPWL